MAFKTYKTYKQIPKETKQFFMDKEGVKDIKKVPLWYINSIMEEWEKVSGVNRQRQGMVGNYEGKATSQQAIVQSSHITEDLFRKLSRFEQRDLQALLDYSKEAWLTGKKGMYVMSDGTKELFDIESMQHMESEYGIFLSDSGQDQDKLDILKQLAQSMVQNGVPASTIAEMVDADNFSQIKEKIKGAEKMQQQLQQAQQQAEAEQQEAQRQLERERIENENMNQEKDRETKIRVAMIQAEAKMMDNEYNLEKSVRDSRVKEQENDLKSQDIIEKVRSNQAKEDLIREDQRLKDSKESSDRREKAEDRRQNREDKEKDRQDKYKDRKIKKEDQAIKRKAAAQKPKSE